MNLENIKSGFIQYLEGLKSSNFNGEYENIDYENLSIFSYQDEFKDYISDEYDVSGSIQSMSINDILDMEVDKSGKLVTLEELEEMEQAAIEAESGVEGIPTDGEISTTGENTVQSDVETEQAEQTEQTIDEEINDETNNQVTTETNEEVAPNMSDEEANLVTGLINEMLQNSDFINAFDTDENSEINTEELSAFLNLANNLDGDTENLTVDDLLNGMEAILNGEDLTEVVQSVQNGTVTEATTETESSDDNKTEAITNGAETTPATSTNRTSGSNGATSTKSFGRTAQSSNDGGSDVKTLETMTESELKTELTNANNELTTEQDNLNKIRTGSTEQLKNLKTDIDEAYEEYQEQLKAVDEDLAKEVDTLKTQLSDKDSEISSQERTISSQENTCTKANATYENAQAKTAALKTRKSELEGKKSGEKDGSILSWIENLIKSITSQITTAVSEESNAKTNKETQEKTLKQQKDELKDLNKDKELLEKQMKEKEEQIREKYPEVTAALDKYKEAENLYTQTQDSLTSSVEEKIAEKKDYIAEVEKALSKKQIETTLQEFPIPGTYNAQKGQALVDAAYEMLNKYGSSKYYCATGVSRTFAIEYGLDLHGNGCDWDTNMDSLVDKGMFIEATQDYPTSNDLSNLPAGAVVCWEGTGGTNGGGAQYGHVTIADGKGGEISDHHAEDIYKSVGGSRTNYKVYLPC